MKRISAIIFTIAIGGGCLAQQKSCLGIDAGRIVREGGISISAGYGFSRRWSASWKMELDARVFESEYDSEYREHLGEFNGPGNQEQPTRGNSITLQYWIDSIYEGAWIEAGCRCTDRMQADCVIGAGYVIPVWKGLKATLSYQTSLLESFRQGKPSGAGLTIGISWIITHGKNGST